MTQFKIFDHNSYSDWQEKLDAFPASQKDVYYSPAYYRTWLEVEDAEACCFWYQEDAYEFLYPFLKGEIRSKSLTSSYYDIQSAYGYGGVISNMEDIPQEVGDRFNESFNKWCEDEHIIAEFIRANPLHEKVFRKVDYELVRNNVYIKAEKDYRIPNRHARQNIRKAEKYNIKVSYDYDMASLDGFVDLYLQNARRINMNPFYFFNDAYFKSIPKLLKGSSCLINLEYETILLGSLMIFYDRNNLSCYLIGINEGFKGWRISDFIYKAAIDFAIEHEIALINMGGGLSSDPGDSLFQFKKKFSDYALPVKVGKYIHDVERYDQLVLEWKANHPDLEEKCKNIFLKYRFCE